MPTMSKISAQAYLADCAVGVPKKWWENMEGQLILEFLRQLQRNVGEYQNPSHQVIYKDIARRFNNGEKPTPMQFLEMVLHKTAPLKVNKGPTELPRTLISRTLRKWSWPDLVWWNDDVGKAPMRAVRDDVWHAWFYGA
ncbi:hypothetical protein IMZ48_45320 [Candidatus Bathyarchaeota archaeon]|nr:hypothetical protein [Candidatus Bathyarchaeota archaeon]